MVPVLFKDGEFEFIVRNLPLRVASYCNIVSSKALSTNQANINIKSSRLGKTDDRLKSKTIFFNIETNGK